MLSFGTHQSFAYQINGGTSNLRIVQSKYSESNNFQVNAKLKTTTIVGDLVEIEKEDQKHIENNSKNNGIVIVDHSDFNFDKKSESNSRGGLLGTANWSYKNRSTETTARKKLLAQKEKLIIDNEKPNHGSAPKAKENIVIVDNLNQESTNTTKEEEEEEKEEKIAENSDIETKKDMSINDQNLDNDSLEISNYNPKKDLLIASDAEGLVLNPKEFFLKFTSEDLQKQKSTPNCYAAYYQNNFYQNDFWEKIANTLLFFLSGLTLVLLCLVFLILLMIKNTKKEKPQKKQKSFTNLLKRIFILTFIIIVSSVNNASASTITTPQELIYEGDLLDNSGNTLDGNYDFRFSLWENEDFQTGDIITGSINPGAIDYLQWQEVQTQNIQNGKFSFRLGTVNTFFAGLFDRKIIYLQVEVKKSVEADSSYEVIDVDPNNNNVDRTVIDSVPFSFNSDKLDFRDTGFAAGEIPYLNDNAQLNESLIPDYINGNTFTLDKDNNEDLISLKFGDVLDKTLSWNNLAGQFEFNDKVNISGDLIVTGTINGKTLGPSIRNIILSPRYPNSIIESDGSNNIGSMYEENLVVAGANKNVLKWNTKKDTIQDYDIIIRYKLPENFAGFRDKPLYLEFLTEGSSNESRIDFTLSKENSTSDLLHGSGINLNSATWTKKDFALNSNEWQAKDIMVFQLKMSAKSNLQSYLGDIEINFHES